ncbi:hypothetical protein BOTBODRAFT_64680 [Botryobasidium botryosum FD-172 SS1]|uniref:Phosphatidylethanolamine-binding protein n=1 Tax=Botryobasidium botryosum (strain FD-172 SS1) TaxID=930990 RepID=A0A067MLX2_BOTB1|nr:hypothetical protein BOTBODRAFT_64680 [Botryobasidium botryosum FD-172 SS1]
MDTLVFGLKNNNLIPDILPESWQPTVNLVVSFGAKILRDGDILAPDVVKPEPTVRVEHADTNATYTLILTDPDAPSRTDPKFGDWRHWVQPGVRVQEDTSTVITEDPHTPYLAPSPGSGTSFHRYLIMLVQEPENFNPAPMGSKFVARRSWKAYEWIKENGGNVVGAAWFLSRNAEDPY